MTFYFYSEYFLVLYKTSRIAFILDQVSSINSPALDEVRYPLEDVGHLPHHPQPLLHQGKQLLVLLSSGALLETNTQVSLISFPCDLVA